MIAAFHQPDALRRVAWLRASAGATVALLIGLGPYDQFYVDLAPLLYGAREPLIPSLGAGFVALRWGTVALGAAVALGIRPALTVPLLAAGFAATTGYVTRFIGQPWSYNAHLLFVLLALSAAPTSAALALVPDPGRGESERERELASFALWFAALCVGLVYFQAGLSKLLFSGPRWFVDGTTAWTFTALYGTALGQSLARWPALFDALHLGSGLIEFAFLPLCLVRRLQPVAASLALAMHAGIGLVMGIWFWHLWALFPALFLAGAGVGNLRRGAR